MMIHMRPGNWDSNSSPTLFITFTNWLEKNQLDIAKNKINIMWLYLNCLSPADCWSGNGCLPIRFAFGFMLFKLNCRLAQGNLIHGIVSFSSYFIINEF